MPTTIPASELGCKGQVIEQRFNVDNFPGLASLSDEELKNMGRDGVGCTHGCPAAEICAKRAYVEKYKEKGTKRLVMVSVTVFPG